MENEKTISEIKNEIKTNMIELMKKYEDDDTEQFILECELSYIISVEMRKNTSFESIKFSSFNSKETYFFSDESKLNTLRSLYKLTSNNFVKSVISTVGKEMKFTSKQLEIIIEEMMKFDTITL